MTEKTKGEHQQQADHTECRPQFNNDEVLGAGVLRQINGSSELCNSNKSLPSHRHTAAGTNNRPIPDGASKKVRRRGTFIKRPIPSLAPSKRHGLDEVIDGWSGRHLQQLREAYIQVDPTSLTFWDDVATRMPQKDKTAHECREKWFSLVKTPKQRSREGGKRSQDDSLARKLTVAPMEEQDDIFNSTPLREGEPTDPRYHYEHQLPADLDLLSLGDERMTVETASDDGKVEVSFQLPVAKPGFKSYLQGLRRDMNRSRKNPKSGRRSTANNDVACACKSAYIRESFQDEDVKMKAELSPGGTLKIHSLGQEEDDFWGLYDEDSGEED
jgi:hypothetical protein